MTKIVQSLQRGLAVLEALNRHNGLNANQIAKRCGLSRGTAHRMLETLRTEGYLLRDEHSGAYWLSIKVRGLSDGYIDELWISNIVRPLIENLGQELVWPVNLTVPSGPHMVVRAGTDYHSRLANYRIPTGWSISMANSASGRAFLAFSSPSDRRTFSELLEKSASAREVPATESQTVPTSDLEQIRESGYASRVSREGVVALAIPVLDKKYAFACLTVRFSSQFVSLEKGLERFLPALRTCSDEIGAQYTNRTTRRPRPPLEEDLDIN